MMEIFQIFVVVVAIATAVWVLYMLTKMDYTARAKRSAAQRALYEAKRDAALYKIEPARDVAVSDADSDNSYFRRDHFEPYCKPKRKYTKRSSFWTAKRKKAAARKAKKKTRKSK